MKPTTQTSRSSTKNIRLGAAKCFRNNFLVRVLWWRYYNIQAYCDTIMMECIIYYTTLTMVLVLGIDSQCYGINDPNKPIRPGWRLLMNLGSQWLSGCLSVRQQSGYLNTCLDWQVARQTNIVSLTLGWFKMLKHWSTGQPILLNQLVRRILSISRHWFAFFCWSSLTTPRSRLKGSA